MEKRYNASLEFLVKIYIHFLLQVFDFPWILVTKQYINGFFALKKGSILYAI
jgi:hypothetical protein